jgi:hypothetical protein
MADFADTIAAAYATLGPALDLGLEVHDGAVTPGAVVTVPLSVMNRHGLVAGVTGTGKTKTLRALAEQPSSAGVPVFVADVNGDLSGLAAPGAAQGPAVKRAGELGLPFAPTAFPVEFLSLGGIGPGVTVRATVSDFGPQLLAKILGANETQEQSLGLLFRYAGQKGLPLLDLRVLLTFLGYRSPATAVHPAASFGRVRGRGAAHGSGHPRRRRASAAGAHRGSVRSGTHSDGASRCARLAHLRAANCCARRGDRSQSLRSRRALRR